jgi:hypothetical protein
MKRDHKLYGIPFKEFDKKEHSGSKIGESIMIPNSETESGWWCADIYKGGNLNLEALVIDHEGLPYMLWQTMIVFLWILSSFVYGVFAAFREYPFAFWKMNIFEYIFLLDFFL